MTMAANVAKLRTKVKHELGADPLRAALANAIEKAGKAREAVTRQRAGVDRVQREVWAGASRIEAAEKAVEDAREAHVEAIAGAAASDHAMPASKVGAAQRAVAKAREEVDANRQALARLRDGLGFLEGDLRAADTAVEAAISAVLAPIGERVTLRARDLLAQLAPFKAAAVALWVADPQPTEIDASIAHEVSRRPLQPARKAAQEFLNSLAEIDRTPNVWAIARERLRKDADAALPELDALVGGG
jgi:hypothetical protein